MARIGSGFNIRNLKKKIEDEWIRKMAEDCEDLVYTAYMTGTYDEETGNLADSIGAAVYRDGKLLEDTLAYRQPRATKPKEWYDGDFRSGHEEMMNYFRNYKPKSMGLTIVLVAAMPYAEVLELGPRANELRTKTPLRHKYKVITDAYGALKALKGKYESDAAKLGYKTAKYGQGIRVTLNINE